MPSVIEYAEPPKGSALRNVMVAALVLLGAFAVFWGLVTGAERAARPEGLTARSAIEFTALDRNGAPLPGAARQVAHLEYAVEYISRMTDKSALMARYDGTFLAPGGEDFALFLPRRADILGVSLNGKPVNPDVLDPRLNGSFVSEPTLYTFPRSSLAAGTNAYSITIKRSLRGPFIFPAFVVGPASQIDPAFVFRNLMAVELSLVGIVIMMFTGLLCMVINWPQQDRGRIRWFISMLMFSAVASVTFMFSGADKYDMAWLIVTSIVIVILSASSLFYVANASQRGKIISNRTIYLIISGLFAVAFVITKWNYIGISDKYYIVIFMITCRLCSIGLSILSAALLAHELARSNGALWLERFILIVWFIATAMDRGNPGLFSLASPFDPAVRLSLLWTPILGSLTGLAIVASFARTASEARRTVVTANEQLGLMLARREAELEKSYQTQRALLQQQATLEERQRLVRDMHDGIGGQLLGLLIQARRRDVAPEVIEEGLQQSMNDLRLIVDSMDSAEESIMSTLRSFEHRIRGQVEAAGVAFAVAYDMPDDTPSPGPSPTLQVLRILQEGVSNALRHSRAKTIRLCCIQDAHGTITLTIADDGIGFDESAPKGRGLLSMQSRAKALVGKLTLTSDEHGTRITLVLPQPKSAPAQASA